MQLMPFGVPVKEALLGKGAQGRKYLVGSLLILSALAIRMLLAQRKQAQTELKAIAWLLREGGKPFRVPELQPYGDLTELNSEQTILRTVGKELLVNVAGDALHLIGTSGAVCEKNKDYASCLVASDWCRFLDQASRGRCAATDNRAALASGEWHCRESGKEVSSLAMQTGKPADIPCKGGINLYAAPIKVDGETVGTIAIGYGDPPKDDERLREVAERYGVQVDTLRELSANMPSRPQFIVAVAKARLRSEAILLGEIIKRKRVEEALADLTKNLEERITTRTQQLRALATELNLAEQQERKRLAVELHDHLQHLLVLGKLKIGQGKRYAPPPALAEVMKQVDDVLSDALRYTRTLVAELSPAVLRDHGLVAALKWLGEYMQKLAMTVTVTVPEQQELSLPEDQAVLLFQSVRELLINSSKYAGTGAATVTLECRDDQLRIQVRDEGAGFDVAAAAAAAGAQTGGLSSKFGLFSIRERMQALGGSFDIQSTPGNGTTATLTLPLLTAR